MKDRVSTKVLENGAIRYGVYSENGDLLRYEYMKAEDEPTQIGTPLNKRTLLRDETAQKLGLTQSNPTVDDAFNGLFTSVSDGKKLVASAITGKGVTTAPDATFQTMSNNIKKISTIPKDVYTVSLTASPAVGGTVAGAGYASKNMKVQVEASPANGYTFGGWKKNGATVSSKESYLFPVTGNTALTAAFEEKPMLEWNSSAIPVSSRWKAIAYGASKFVVIGNNGVTNDATVVYSTDGITWGVSSIPSNGMLRDVTYGNGKFVAVGPAGRLFYSIDGIRWENASSGPTVNLECVAYGNGKFVAAGSGAGFGYDAAYSTDGINFLSYATSATTGLLHLFCITYSRLSPTQEIITVLFVF